MEFIQRIIMDLRFWENKKIEKRDLKLKIQWMKVWLKLFKKWHQ